MVTLAQARTSKWSQWLLDNPVFVREVRRRMRGRVFSMSLVLYIILLGVITCLIMFGSYPMAMEMRPSRDVIQKIGNIGNALFTGMVVLEAILAVLVAPLLTSGVATAEKDRHTFDFLRVTTLSAGTFVTGCLLTSAAMLLLVISCTLPILGLTFIFGGVSMDQILTTDAVIFALGMLFSSAGIFHSTGAGKNRGIRTISMIILLFLMFSGLPILLQALRVFGAASSGLFGTDLGWPGTLLCVDILIMLTVLFALAAARRLYEPNNRVLSYTQFGTMFVVTMAGLCLLALNFVRNQAKTIAPGDYDGLLSTIHLSGAAICVIAVLLFSAGRVERGDELWRLRLKRPFFRRVDERFFIYPFFLLIWVAAVSVLMWVWWDQTAHFRDCAVMSIPLLAAILFTTWSVCRFVSLNTHMRGRAALAAAFLLLLFWGILPILGYFMREVPGSMGWGSTARMSEIGGWLIDASPIAALGRIWEDHPLLKIGYSTVVTCALGVLLLAPTLTAKARAKFAVSYDLDAPDSRAQDAQVE